MRLFNIIITHLDLKDMNLKQSYITHTQFFFKMIKLKNIFNDDRIFFIISIKIMTIK